MEFLSPELLEKFLSPKDIVTVSILIFMLKKNTASHFGSIEESLAKIGRTLVELKDSILELEIKQTRKINNLSERVARIESNLKGE